MKRFAVLFVVLAVFCSFSLVGCGSDRVSQGKDMALEKYSELRSCSDGKRAEMLASGVVKNLADIGLKLSAIHLKESELSDSIRGAYFRQASKAWASMQTLHSDPTGSDKLREEILFAQERAGKSVTSRKVLDQAVMRNSLEFAARQGLKPSPTDYRRAGLKPFEVVVIKEAAKPSKSTASKKLPQKKG
jgi:hypothetical protein